MTAKCRSLHSLKSVSPFLVKARFELVIEGLRAVEEGGVLPLLKDHQVEEVLQLSHFEGFEARFFPRQLHELVDVLKSA